MSDRDFISEGGFIVPQMFVDALSDTIASYKAAAPRAPLTRKERFARWRSETSYRVREAIAQRVLPDGPWHDEDDW